MRSIICLLLLTLLAGGVAAQDAQNWAVDLANSTRIVPNITYLTADSFESKLDLYVPRGQASSPRPVVMYIHGGGWVGGAKESSMLQIMPYLQMGWAAVNVEYRLGRVALAPGAVEDCRCALRWIKNNAEQYGLDPDRIVVTGHSAGGHLSLTTGMLTADAGLDRRCPTRNPDGNRADAALPEMSVAAIVNWFGITDVGDLVEGPNAKTYAVAWMGSMPNWEKVAERVSPLNYVRKGLPPILTIHGDADTIVPYQHAVRLHESLEKTGVTNHLHTVPGGGHGGFSRDQARTAFDVIRKFLAEAVPGAAESPSP